MLRSAHSHVGLQTTSRSPARYLNLLDCAPISRALCVRRGCSRFGAAPDSTFSKILKARAAACASGSAVHWPSVP